MMLRTIENDSECVSIRLIYLINICYVSQKVVYLAAQFLKNVKV